MQRLQGWVRYAAQQLPVGAAAEPQQQQQEEDEDSFIYGRVAVHSDDEDTGNAAVAAAHTCHAQCLSDTVSHVPGQEMQYTCGLAASAAEVL
jgi:hypothetical protein